MKGITRQVVPYAVEALLDSENRKAQILSEHTAGMDLYLDIGRIAPADRPRAREALAEAIAALDAASGKGSNPVYPGAGSG